MKRLFCCKRQYAEVYSQAYSLDQLEDEYLAKQRRVPSSSSMLSSNYSTNFDGREDELNELITAVDVFQIDAAQKERQRAKRISRQTPLASMALKTVTSIEGQGSGEFDVEAHLDDDDSLFGEGLEEISETKQVNKQIELDAKNYHTVSRYFAKMKNGRFGRRRQRKNRVSPIFRMKERVMKNKRSVKTNEDAPKEEEIRDIDRGVGKTWTGSNEANQLLRPFMVIRNVSSTSAPYLETSSQDS